MLFASVLSLYFSFYAVSFTHHSVTHRKLKNVFNVCIACVLRSNTNISIIRYTYSHARARSLSAFISFRLLFCILFESIRICLFIIFSSGFLCVLSCRTKYTHSRSVYPGVGRVKNSQLKHILLDQHKIHRATKSLSTEK